MHVTCMQWKFYMQVCYIQLNACALHKNAWSVAAHTVILSGHTRVLEQILSKTTTEFGIQASQLSIHALFFPAQFHFY